MPEGNTKATGEFFHRVMPNLANLDVCIRICGVLTPYLSLGARPPALNIAFLPKGPAIQSTNCGVFTTPVIISALIDVRKFLHFFGLKVGAEGIEKTKKKNSDFDITDLGLPLVSKEKYIELLVANNVPSQNLSDAVFMAVRYVNKDIAHFTRTNAEPNLSHIALACISVEEAVRKFVCEPTGVEFPDLQIK